jgi:hypothetical protein
MGRYAAVDRGLPGWGLACSGLNYLAHQDLIDLGGVYPGALNGSADGGCTQLHGAET